MAAALPTSYAPREIALGVPDKAMEIAKPLRNPTFQGIPTFQDKQQERLKQESAMSSTSPAMDQSLY